MLIRTVLALLLLLAPAASAQDLDTALSALVRISGTRNDTPVRGSGFVVVLDSDKATIVTASHVIEGTQQLEVTFAADPTESFPAGVVLGMEAGNPRGLAVFQVRGRLPAVVTTLSFDTEVQLQGIEELILLGFPQMASSPLILKRSFAGPNGNLLQLDGPVGEGFSGAPVLRKGFVIGVVTDEDQRLTFAVKAAVARDAAIGWGAKLAEACVPGEKLPENGIVFIRICPGTYTMGSADNDPQADAEEKPAHQVKLSAFWLARTETTNWQYRRFRPDHKREDGLPVTNVDWFDAKAACESFGGRLPTEAEWEYAARAGSSTAWWFGDDETLLGDYAWYARNSDGKPQFAGTRKPNPWGLHDMHGSVWEWVADRYAPYSSAPQTDPTGPDAGTDRVFRGGAFKEQPGALRSAGRVKSPPEYKNGGIGFRCARDARLPA